jgi:hypothetical protein
MGVAACIRCSTCGSDLAQAPDLHTEPVPQHDYVTKFDQNTGEPYQVCRRCFQRQDEEEETSGGAPSAPA